MATEIRYAVYVVVVEDTEQAYIDVSDAADSIGNISSDVDYDRAMELLKAAEDLR